MSPTTKRSFGERFLSLAPGLAATWAAFWSLVTWNVITESAGAGAVIGSIFSIVAAGLPAAMLYLRRQRTATEEQIAEPTSVPPAQLRLLAAFEQVEGLVTAGVIEASVLRGLDERIEELGRLLAADVSNQALGGQASGRLEEQAAQLTDLLVGLADAALDRRSAALDTDDLAATSLREALAQMRAEEQGFRELEEIDDRDER